MIKWHVLLTLTILISFWNQICSKDYLVASVGDVSLSEHIQVVTGSKAGGTRIGRAGINVRPYRRKTVLRHITSNKSVRISTTGNTVDVYGAFGSSYFSLLPITALGTKYIVLSCHPPGQYSSVLVIATHSQETNVNITFNLNGTLTLDGQDYMTGSTLTFSLEEFKARTIRSSFDLTGSVVRSQQSVAVFTGLVFRENLVAYNQLLPVTHYGQEYVVAVDDNIALYKMLIISEHEDTRILFNNGSVVCMGNSFLYRRTLERNESSAFTSSKPIMAAICRENGDHSGATVVPPVNTFTNISLMHIRSVIKILTDRNATDVQVNSKSASIAIDWEDIPNTRYRVGTSNPRSTDVLSIKSDSNVFTVLAYYTTYTFNGGYYFGSSQKSADMSHLNGTECPEEEDVNLTTEVKDFLVAKVTEDLGFPEVELVTGNTGAGTVIGDESTNIQSFERRTIFTDGEDTVIQISSNGTSVNLYGYFESSYFSLLPISALGSHYIVSSCRPPSEYTVMLVIATHSQKTNVTVTFKLNGTLSFEGQIYRDGTTLKLILDGFDARYISSLFDLTGTVVRASQSIAVYSGLVYKRRIIAYGQLVPVNRFGQEYVVAVDDNTAPYQLQIISEYQDTSITFNGESGICVGKSGIYHRRLEQNENLVFVSNNPVMTSLCRVNDFQSGFTTVPPVNAYTKNSAISKRDVIKVFIDQNATDVLVRVKSKTVPLDWEEISGSRFKVGTSKSDKLGSVSISSETSDFAVYNMSHLNGTECPEEEDVNLTTEVKDFLVAKVTEDLGFPEVELVTGNTGAGTVIGDESTNIQSFERRTIFTDGEDTVIQISSNGTSVNLYGYFESSYFSLLPISALGSHYIVSSCRPPSEYTVMLVIATHSQKTNVTVTFKLNGTLSFEGQIYRDGTTLRLILDGFDARYISSLFDLTGTVVRASQSIAVYSGLVYKRRIIAYGQLVPVNRFGQEYVVAVDDNTAPYQLQIISEYQDTSITFNGESGICVGKSGIYHRRLEQNENLVFVSNNPVMTSLCRVNDFQSGFTTVPPVNAYTKNSAISKRDVIKVFTDQNATDVLVRVKSKTVLVDWEEISGSRFKVGTSKPDKLGIVSISSETSDFAVLAFDHLYTFNGGYNFSSKPQNTDIRLTDQTVCSNANDGSSILDKIKQGSVGDISNASESEQSSLLEDILKIDSKSFEDVTAFVANITQDIKPSARNLKSIASIMENNNVTSNISKQAVENVLEIYNKVLETPPEILAEAQGKDNVANRLLQIVDTITDRLEPPEGGNSTFVTESFTAVVFDLRNETNPENFPLGLQITETSSESETGNLRPIFQGEHNNTPSTDVQSESAVYFQEQLLQQTVNNNTGKNIRLLMNYYNKPVLFNVIQNSSRSSLKSKVISAKILVDGDSITDLSATNITLVFPQNESQPTDPQISYYSCVYWNFSGNNAAGSWSKGGCYLTKTKGQNKCVCNHLTNFAVLLDYYGQENAEPTHALVLSVITKIGLILSIVGLTTTAVTHVMFREKRFAVETRPQTTLFNLALAQLCSWVVFLVGIDRTENRVGCIVVAALLHYFILASFMWMLAMAILYYLLFVKVLGTHTSRYMLKTGVPAWGIPVLPVVAVLAIDVDLYKGGESYCWMSVTAFYYAFGTPVGLILLINIVLYIMVVVSICRRTTTAGRSNQNRSYLKNIKASFLSFIILGLSWIFGFLAISDARIVFQYIFCITSSIQGFLIFVFFTLQDQRFRDNWRTWCCRLRDRVAPRRRSKLKHVPLSKTTSETTDPSKVTEDTV